MKDGTGREFDDELTNFLKWYLDAGQRIFTPLDNSIHFVEGLTSLCIYRYEPFQAIVIHEVIDHEGLNTHNIRTIKARSSESSFL